MRLTKRQKEVVKLMSDNIGSFLRPHIKISGTRCYRLMSKENSPLANIRAAVILNLEQKEKLKKENNVLVLLNAETQTTVKKPEA